MGCVNIPMKTWSVENVVKDFTEVKPCKIHNLKPEILHIVAGKDKKSHYVARCTSSDNCNKITMDSAEAVIDLWNKYN